MELEGYVVRKDLFWHLYKPQWENHSGTPLGFWSKVRASTTKYTPFIKQCLACCWVTADRKCRGSGYHMTSYELPDPPDPKAGLSKQPFVVRWKWYI